MIRVDKIIDWFAGLFIASFIVACGVSIYSNTSPADLVHIEIANRNFYDARVQILGEDQYLKQVFVTGLAGSPTKIRVRDTRQSIRFIVDLVGTSERPDYTSERIMPHPDGVIKFTIGPQLYMSSLSQHERG